MMSQVSAKSSPLLVWPSCYYVSGTLQLPYAEINEPFTAYFEAKKNRSRIDYYGAYQFDFVCIVSDAIFYC